MSPASGFSGLPTGFPSIRRRRRRSHNAHIVVAMAMTPSGTLTPASTATQDEDDCISVALEDELLAPLFFKNPASGMTVAWVNLKGSSYLQRTVPLSAMTLLQQYSVFEKL